MSQFCIWENWGVGFWKFKWKYKGHLSAENVQVMLIKGAELEKWCYLTYLTLQSCYIDTCDISTFHYLGKNWQLLSNERVLKQWYCLESPEIDWNLYDKVTLDKNTAAIHWGGYKPWLLPYALQKTNQSEMDHRPKYKSKEQRLRRKYRWISTESGSGWKFLN